MTRETVNRLLAELQRSGLIPVKMGRPFICCSRMNCAGFALA